MNPLVSETELREEMSKLLPVQDGDTRMLLLIFAMAKKVKERAGEAESKKFLLGCFGLDENGKEKK